MKLKTKLRLILGLAFECKFYTVGPTSHNYKLSVKLYFRVSSINFLRPGLEAFGRDTGTRDSSTALPIIDAILIILYYNFFIIVIIMFVTFIYYCYNCYYFDDDDFDDDDNYCYYFFFSSSCYCCNYEFINALPYVVQPCHNINKNLENPDLFIRLIAFRN